MEEKLIGTWKVDPASVKNQEAYQKASRKYFITRKQVISPGISFQYQYIINDGGGVNDTVDDVEKYCNYQNWFFIEWL